MTKIPRRQAHLNLHTSPDIPGIGSRFDKQQFRAALKASHAESITVFAKYHPEAIKKTWLGMTGEKHAMTREGGKQKVIVPKLECHASVVLEYGGCVYA